jgi:hypothetical protein
VSPWRAWVESVWWEPLMTVVAVLFVMVVFAIHQKK